MRRVSCAVVRVRVPTWFDVAVEDVKVGLDRPLGGPGEQLARPIQTGPQKERKATVRPRRVPRLHVATVGLACRQWW